MRTGKYSFFKKALTKNKLPIPAVNPRAVRKGRKISSDKSAFLQCICHYHNKQMIGPTNYRAKRSFS